MGNNLGVYELVFFFLLVGGLSPFRNPKMIVYRNVSENGV